VTFREAASLCGPDSWHLALPIPTLSIIILSWNVRDLLRKCLSSLPLEAPGVEVIVVDAASVDGSAGMVKAEFPAVRLMAEAENLGYTRGNNLGLRAANGEYLLILNPDTEVVGEALAQMVAYMEAHPQVGVLGPQLIHPDGAVQSTRRRFPTLITAFFESTWLQPLAPRSVLSRYYALDMPEAVAAEVDWVMGAALLVRRKAYVQVGGFDEDFFMYSEEVDWCRRMKTAGWRVAYFPPARIIHHVGRSSEQVPAATHIRFNASKVRYFRKHHGVLAGEVLRWYLLGNFASQLALEGAKWLVGSKRPLRAARLKAYWQVLGSGLK
jgi:N-acetylglucosaminyl-diphospho-decaprenol L-rhamnosyltransferase